MRDPAPEPPSLTLAEEAGIRFVEGPQHARIVHRIQDSGLIVEACFSHQAGAALLYAANLPDTFFDLSSGEAGELLQKLRNYRLRLAVVCLPESVHFSTRFHEMAVEEARGRYFGLFDSRESAVRWLTQS